MQIAPYGSWASPITPETVTAVSIRYADSVELDGDAAYWSESRPQEGGRSVIVRCDADGTRTDAVPPGFNARTRVHEYGGGAFAVHQGVVYASSFEDQRLYRIAPGEDPVPITPVPPTPAGVRFADFTFGDGFLVAVRERHGSEGELLRDTISSHRRGSVPTASPSPMSHGITPTCPGTAPRCGRWISERPRPG
jgi:hypothetical protein